jgi:AcrR family transcriptional regulator
MTRASGLRERKKQKTREAIQREALRLFAAQGYSATTIEQIAAAAEISPSTFFNYFPTKEDVVLYDSYDPIVISSLTNGPTDESFRAAFRRAMDGLAVEMERDREMILVRARLWLKEPSLRARLWEEMERAKSLIAALLAARSGRDANDFELQVIAMALVSASFEASLEWVRQDGRGNLLTFIDQALSFIDAPGYLDRIEPAKRQP